MTDQEMHRISEATFSMIALYGCECDRNERTLSLVSPRSLQHCDVFVGISLKIDHKRLQLPSVPLGVCVAIGAQKSGPGIFPFKSQNKPGYKDGAFNGEKYDKPPSGLIQTTFSMFQSILWS